MSAQGQPAPDIAHLLRTSEDYIRDVIHAFSERGFDALNPKWSGAHRDGSMSRPETGSASSPGATPASSADRSPAGR
ncbi:helix-turn-helix domain-containing protein [Micromonospora carbonacea]|uniref:helix-turn-helix domain-containing protein n=1 Tax=Micromonospora carbonacea TaxID=47853 RepID=UPI00210BCF6A|nr:helix-turn-helix domain-containing protein [Micromonospora carbonacea]